MTNDPTELLARLSTLIDSQQEALANLEQQRLADLGSQAELFRSAQKSAPTDAGPSTGSTGRESRGADSLPRKNSQNSLDPTDFYFDNR